MRARSDAAAARERKTNRLAELVWHLTECDPHDAAEIVEMTDTRIEFTHPAVLLMAARALVTLEATGPRPVRVPGFLRRAEIVGRSPVAHHTSLRRWDRTVPADERARAFVRDDVASLREGLAAAQRATADA